MSSSNLLLETGELKHLLDIMKSEIKTEMNCISVGTIKKFNSTNQTADVQINYKKVLKRRNALDAAQNQYSDVIIPYPVLIGCPVIVLNGGGSFISFPIAVGDTCLVFFCDRDIENWLTSGTPGTTPNSERTHDLTDAIVLVGIKSLATPIGSYDSANLKIALGIGKITIDPNGNIIVEGKDVTVNGQNISVNGTNITLIGSTKVSINP